MSESLDAQVLRELGGLVRRLPDVLKVSLSATVDNLVNHMDNLAIGIHGQLTDIRTALGATRDSRIVVNDPNLLIALREMTGFTTWNHPRQAELVQAALGTQNLFGIVPTGAGKTVAFVLPSHRRLNPLRRTTVVIVPYISTRNDILNRVSRYQVDVATWSPDMDASNPPVILVAVFETAFSKPFLDWLRAINPARIIFDEGHTPLTENADNRRDGRAVPWRSCLEHLDKYAAFDCPKSIFSATLPPSMVETLARTLRMVDYVVVREPVARPEIRYSVTVSDAKDHEEFVQLHVLPALQALKPREGMVVFCDNREACDVMARATPGGKAYHRGIDEKQLEVVLKQFDSGQVLVLYATRAYGCGNNPELPVRKTIHRLLPSSMFSWLQYSGRGGRDGGPSDDLVVLPPTYNHPAKIPVQPDQLGVKAMIEGIQDPLRCLRSIHGEFFDGKGTSCVALPDSTRYCERCEAALAVVPITAPIPFTSTPYRPFVPRLPPPIPPRTIDPTPARHPAHAPGFYPTPQVTPRQGGHPEADTPYLVQRETLYYAPPSDVAAYMKPRQLFPAPASAQHPPRPLQNLSNPLALPPGTSHQNPLPPPPPLVGISNVIQLDARIKRRTDQAYAERARTFRQSAKALRSACIGCYVVSQTYTTSHDMNSHDCPSFKSAIAGYKLAQSWNAAKHGTLAWPPRRICYRCQMPFDLDIHRREDCDRDFKDVVGRTVAFIWTCHADALAAYMAENHGETMLGNGWASLSDFRQWCQLFPDDPELREWCNIHLAFEWYILACPIPGLVLQ